MGPPLIGAETFFGLAADAWVAVLTGGLVIATVVLAVSSWKAAQSAAEATATLTRAVEGLPLVAVGQIAPDSNDPNVGPRVQFANRGDATADSVRARVETFVGHSVELEREALSNWTELGAILPGSVVPSHSVAAEGELEPRFVSLPISHRVDEWGALEHHDEWLVSIEYTSVGGTRLRTIWSYSGDVLAHEVIRQG